MLLWYSLFCLVKSYHSSTPSCVLFVHVSFSAFSFALNALSRINLSGGFRNIIIEYSVPTGFPAVVRLHTQSLTLRTYFLTVLLRLGVWWIDSRNLI